MMAQVSQIAVAEHYAFGCSGCSRSVNQRRQIIGRDSMCFFIKFRVLFRRGGVDQRPHWNHIDFADVIHHNNFFQRSLFPDSLNFAQLFQRGNKDHSRAGVLQQIEGLVGRERSINRYVNDPGGHAGEVGNHPFRSIFTQDRNTVAFVDSPLLQDPGKCRHITVKLTGRDHLPCAAALEHYVAFHIMRD